LLPQQVVQHQVPQQEQQPELVPPARLLEHGLQLSCAVVLQSACLFGFYVPFPAAAAARHVQNYYAAAAGVAAALQPSENLNCKHQSAQVHELL
jgi:hypothetical protein